MKHNYLLFVSKPYSFSILRPLQQAIQSQGHTAAWFISGLNEHYLREDETLLKSVDHVRAFNPAAVFVPGNWVPDFFPGVKVEIFHGFGIEKKGHFNIRGFFDLYCTHGPLTTQPFQSLADKYGYFTVTETGWPKMDPLFNAKGHTIRGKHSDQKKQILYAPTFSPSLKSCDDLFTGIRDLSRSNNWDWIIKFHPKASSQDRERFQGISGANLRIADEDDILPLLHDADVLLTDTSSVISEFLLLDKPVVTYNTKEPGEHVINFVDPEELHSRIDCALSQPNEHMQAAKQYIDQMHPYRDGKSSERVLEATQRFIADKTLRSKLKPKPLNLFRRLKARKKLGYYRIK